LPINLYSVTFFLNPSTYVPTGSFASCAGVGQSTFAVAGCAALGISGVLGTLGVSGCLVSTSAGAVMIICSGSKLIGL
jgi:hypothetical protein